jgi:hypothetical protein
MSISRKTVSLSLLAALLSAVVASAPAQAADRPTSPAGRVIVYETAHSPGVSVHRRAQAKRLHGAPAPFKRFIGRTAQRITDASSCDDGYVGMTVSRLRTDGFAAGGVNDCGGYAALWALANGHWKQIEGTQDTWACGPLHRYRVPSSIAGRVCYDYRHQVERHYHQR